MGSSLSKISDDYDDYYSLCEKYNEKAEELYSNHYHWLKDKSINNTSISFKEYDFEKKKEKSKYRIESINVEIKRLEDEKKELIKKYNL